MNKNLNDYSIREVKRRKEGICKHCNMQINKGDIVNIVESENFFSSFPNIIGITHIDCTEKFIKRNILETSIWHL